jgi:hypothetical protein
MLDGKENNALSSPSFQEQKNYNMAKAFDPLSLTI